MELDNLLILIMLVVALVSSVIYIVARNYAKDYLVFEYQVGLLFKDGKLRRTLHAGRYRLWGKGWSLTVLDQRPATTVVGNQEILTKDGMAVKLSNTVRYAVEDPIKAIMNSQEYLQDAYQGVQVAMRDVVTGLTADEILVQRDQIASAVAERCLELLQNIGLKLEKVELRDITFPGELRRAMAQVALAQKEGLAALERARGEVAALRSLANAAKMLEGNPGLLQLRMIQAIGEGKSGTLVLNAIDKPSPGF